MQKNESVFVVDRVNLEVNVLIPATVWSVDKST